MTIYRYTDTQYLVALRVGKTTIAWALRFGMCACTVCVYISIACVYLYIIYECASANLAERYTLPAGKVPRDKGYTVFARFLTIDEVKTKPPYLFLNAERTNDYELYISIIVVCFS